MDIYWTIIEFDVGIILKRNNSLDDLRLANVENSNVILT